MRLSRRVDVVEHDTPEPVTGILSFLRDFADHRLNSHLIDERRCLPPSLVLELGRAGLLGLQVEKVYGGQELSSRDTFRVVEQAAAIDPNLTLLISVHNAIGIPPVRLFAPEERKAEVLPLLASGASLATVANSEPGAGSDVRAISTTARRLPTGDYLLNGAKSWISLGSWAGYVSVFAQLEDERRRPSGITGFLVETRTPGFLPGAEVLTLGMRGIPQNHITLRDLRLGPGALLGQEGHGLQVAQSAFMAGRTFVGAVSLGAMKRCLQMVERYASRRTVATGRLLENGRVRQMLTESVMATRAVESLLAHIAGRLDTGLEVPAELYLTCKTLSSELMWRVVDSSVQLLGARGYMDTNIVGQHFRDYRLLRIFEGATEAVTVYLGTTVLKDPGSFARLLSEGFGATAARESFERHLADLPPTREVDHVLANATGEIASWAILAAVTAAKAAVGEEIDEHTALWCRRALDERIRAARAASASASGEPLPSEILRHQIGNYAKTIGDTEQTLPGVTAHLDPALVRS